MVWIHGGGFSIGLALGFDLVNRYMEHDIVVVVIQYRLGPLGKTKYKSFLIVSLHKI
jgi:carboxylesterase type B